MRDLLLEFEAALDDCGKWAGGTECRQNANGKTRYYNLNDLCTVLKRLDAAAHGQPLTAAQERAARRIIALTRWGTTPRRKGGSAGNNAGKGQGVFKSSRMKAPQTAAQQRENFREIQRGYMPIIAEIRRFWRP